MKIYIITSHHWVPEYHTHANCILRIYKSLDDAINYVSWLCNLDERELVFEKGYMDFEDGDGTVYTISEHILE